MLKICGISRARELLLGYDLLSLEPGGLEWLARSRPFEDTCFRRLGQVIGSMVHFGMDFNRSLKITTIRADGNLEKKAILRHCPIRLGRRSSRLPVSNDHFSGLTFNLLT